MRYRLQIASGTTVYSLQRSTGAVTLSRVAASLPVGAPLGTAGRPISDRRGGARGQARLAVGRPRGLRRAKRGGPAVRVPVRARGAPVRRIRVVLRNRRGKVVAASRRFALKAGRRRVARVRLRVADSSHRAAIECAPPADPTADASPTVAASGSGLADDWRLAISRRDCLRPSRGHWRLAISRRDCPSAPVAATGASAISRHDRGHWRLAISRRDCPPTPVPPLAAPAPPPDVSPRGSAQRRLHCDALKSIW